MYDNVTKTVYYYFWIYFSALNNYHLKKQESEFFEFLFFITVKCDCIEFSKIYIIFEEALYCTAMKYLLRMTRENYHSLYSYV